MSNEPSAIDKTLTAVTSAKGSQGVLTGGCTVIVGIVCISITYAVPEDFENIVQWGCVAIMGIGFCRIVFANLN